MRWEDLKKYTTTTMLGTTLFLHAPFYDQYQNLYRPTELSGRQPEDITSNIDYRDFQTSNLGITMKIDERVAVLEEKVARTEENLKELKNVATREDIREFRQEMRELFNRLENKVNTLDNRVGENSQKLSEIHGGLKASKFLIPIIIGLITTLVTAGITIGLTFWKLIPYVIKSMQTLPKH